MDEIQGSLYAHGMTAPAYREKYVAFVDLLGFSNLVQRSANDEMALKAVVDAIERLKDTACENPATDTLITYFSDCLVLSCERSPRALISMLQNLVTIAENLLVVDVMVRGALTVGKIHHDRHFMFGPAMIEAYRMECKEVSHPAIMLCPVVSADIEASGFQLWMMHDDAEPERKYLHYLINFQAYDPTPRAGTVVLDGPARLVRHYLAKRIAEHKDESLLSKATWLERYWNDTVGAQGILGMVDRDADRIRPDAQPFRSQRFIVGKGPEAKSAG
ncbi:hypothetical protein [Novosphingobium aureum]|uniref:hypothetical protein n=1 Tax=Novosphingobium aureum TaxID=2792964 RepID=UPI0018CD5070|nr:hypothetical protein [Novosphingobium aureum]